MCIYIDEMSGKVSLKEKKITKYTDVSVAPVQEPRSKEIISIWEDIDSLLQNRNLSEAIPALLAAACWQLWSRGIPEEDAIKLFAQSYREHSKSWQEKPKKHDQKDLALDGQEC